MPTGRRPHVSPRMSWSISISCSPYSNVKMSTQEIRKESKDDYHRYSRNLIPNQRCRPWRQTRVCDLYEVCGDRKGCGRFGPDDRINHREELYHIAISRRHLKFGIILSKDIWVEKQTDVEPCNASLSRKDATHFIRSVESWSLSWTTGTPWNLLFIIGVLTTFVKFVYNNTYMRTIIFSNLGTYGI